MLNTKNLIATGKMNTECSNVIFLDDDNTILEFFLEGRCNEVETNFWVRLPLVSDHLEKIIKVQYGGENEISNGELEFSGEFMVPFKDACPGHFSEKSTMAGKYISGINPVDPKFEWSNAGSTSHSHSKTVLMGLSSEIEENLCCDDLNTVKSHVHTVTIDTDIISHTPPYTELSFCFARDLRLMINAVVLYSSMEDINSNIDMDFYSSANGTFFRGVENTPGDTGGNENHFHTTLSATSTTESPEDYYTNRDIFAFDQWNCDYKHTHQLNPKASTQNSHVPLHQFAYAAVQNIDHERSPSDGQIFMTTHVLPGLGYEIVDEFNDVYLRIGDYGRSGGSLSHMHFVWSISQTVNHIVGPIVISGSELDPPTVTPTNHQHSTNVQFDLRSNEISRARFFFYKRKTSLEFVFEGDEHDVTVNPFNPNPPEFDLSKFWADNYLWISISSGSVLGVLVCLILLVIIISIIVCICICVAKKKKMEKLGFEPEALEMETTGGESGPKFKVDKKLSVIDIADIKLIKELGKGAEGAVYEVKWRNKKAAFKVFRTKSFDSKSNFDKFEAEAMVMSSIHHPNIISFYGISVKEPRIGIVCELATLGDVQAYITTKKGKIKAKEKFTILEGIASGLEHLHSLNIIHRDIKSANVFLQKGPIAKLGDFGLSRICQEMNVKKTVRIGTQIYMAPEVCKGEKYTTKVDIHSYGIVMWEIMHESFDPFRGHSDVDMGHIEFKIASDPNFRPIVDKDLPDWVRGLMQSCWNAVPDLRPSSKTIRKMIVKNGNL